jgi:hypothetical protein
MRRLLPVLAAFAAVAAVSQESKAQGGGFGDPFNLYYGYFLPRQAAIANQPRVEDTINQAVAANQVYAQTNRSGTLDPYGRYGDPYASVDPLDPSRRSRGTGYASTNRGTTPSSNLPGNGPPIYYNRSAQYYPGMANRSPRGPNRNLAVAGRGVRGNSASIPGAQSSGIPGPR